MVSTVCTDSRTCLSVYGDAKETEKTLENTVTYSASNEDHALRNLLADSMLVDNTAIIYL